MNNNKINYRVSPKLMILVYHDKNRDNFYLEKREIKSVGEKVQLQAPQPLPDKVLKDIAQSYTKSDAAQMRHEQMIPGHMLHGSYKIGQTIVMWYRPAMKRLLNFSASLRIKGESNVQIPATLFVLINGKLYIYALMNDDRPNRSTKLFNAPFFNIYTDGNVCMGTAHVGRRTKTYEGETERYERAFFMAEQNGGQSEKNCKTSLGKLWSDLIKKKSAFPGSKELLQHPKYKTLGALMEKLIGNNQNDDDYEEENEETDPEGVIG